jgi:hypothetical protein
MNTHFPKKDCARQAIAHAEEISAQWLQVAGSTAETLSRATRSKKISRGREQKIPGPKVPMAAAIEFE